MGLDAVRGLKQEPLWLQGQWEKGQPGAEPGQGTGQMGATVSLGLAQMSPCSQCCYHQDRAAQHEGAPGQGCARCCGVWWRAGGGGPRQVLGELEGPWLPAGLQGHDGYSCRDPEVPVGLARVFQETEDKMVLPQVL